MQTARPARRYDRLRAILHNTVRHGPESQNRSATADFQAHLRGRMAWVASLNPARAEKLRRLYETIDRDADDLTEV